MQLALPLALPSEKYIDGVVPTNVTEGFHNDSSGGEIAMCSADHILALHVGGLRGFVPSPGRGLCYRDGSRHYGQ